MAVCRYIGQWHEFGGLCLFSCVVSGQFLQSAALEAFYFEDQVGFVHSDVSAVNKLKEEARYQASNFSTYDH